MMKRRDVIGRIAKAAKQEGITWKIAREGGRHTVYSLNGLMIPIARHSEIDDRMAETIFKECEPELGRRWWK